MPEKTLPILLEIIGHLLVKESVYEDFADFQDKGGKRPIPCKDEHEMNKSKMCC